MYTLVLIIHLIVCAFLIFIVLIQSSKGAEMGAAFGGSNQTLFGSRGAATVLTKLTTASAILFMLTSLSLAVISFKRGSVMSSVPKQTSANPLAGAGANQGPMKAVPAAPEQGNAAKEPAKPAEPVK
ncbi:MAG: preprotein translocase subunit SecG [Nitrospirae bacterium]|nr:preprotein translocase subunit SecG [Nitrospirota bacterium]